VVAQAPEHVIDNLRLAAKAGGKKFVKRQPPEKGFVPWDEQTFRRLIDAQPEKLVSRFQVTHGMLLNVLSRPTDGCLALRELIKGCHDGERDRKNHLKRAWQLFRPLVERGIIEFIEPAGPGMAKLRVNAELQADFSMNQTLSLYLMDTWRLLDRESPTYALDLLTLVESILENPELILRQQLSKLRTRRVQEMKAEGVEYEQRMEELEKLEYPKPLREFVYDTFNAFSVKHPWVGTENIRPKSIAREMFEEFRTFSDYVKEYDLQRTEGLLLRHLNSVYKVLSQTVPEEAKTEEVREMETYLGALIHQVDSSLLDEWEKLRNPDFQAEETAEQKPPGAEEAARDITRDAKAFTALVRNRILSFLAAFAKGWHSEALSALSGEATEHMPLDLENELWTENRLSDRLRAYLEEHDGIRLDAEGRNARNTHVEVVPERGVWVVSQVLQEALGARGVLDDGIEPRNDWAAVFEVDLAASRTAGEAVLKLVSVGDLAG
jgi:hypothetical protein